MSFSMLGWLLPLVDVLVVLIVAVVISANRKPSSAIAWILVVVFIPVAGLIAFLVLGLGKLPPRRRAKQQEVCDAALERAEGTDHIGQRENWPAWLAPTVSMNTKLGSLPMTAGNTVDLIEGYAESIETMAAAIDRAHTYVHVEFFILVADDTTEPLIAALERARKRGVQVRVLSDHVSQLLYPRRKETARRLTAMGAQYRPMLPLQPWRGRWRRPDLRNHRKLVVIDGVTGFAGSQNLIADHYQKRRGIRRGQHWKELMMEISGPAVSELDAVFVTDWYSETDEMLALPPPTRPSASGSPSADAQVIPSGPSFDNENNLKLFSTMINNATRRVGVTSPYYVPDETIQMAMITAALSGLEVELFVSEAGDQFMVYHAQRSYYEQLLRAGVRIHLYRSPTILHAKHLTIDDDVSLIGSSNLDIRSLSLHMELSVLVHDPELTQWMRQVEDRYRSASRELTLDEWMQRPSRHQILDNLMRLTSALQ